MLTFILAIFVVLVMLAPTWMFFTIYVFFEPADVAQDLLFSVLGRVVFAGAQIMLFAAALFVYAIFPHRKH